jgi:hypothetical protein
MKFGRNRPVDLHTKKHLRFGAMKAAGVLPTVVVPETTNFAANAAPSLSRIYLNDVLGDCVCAGFAHARGNVTFNWQQPGVVYTDDQIAAMYSQIGGYDPSQVQPDGSNPTDQGCDENTAISVLKSTGYPDGAKICRAIAVDATDIVQVREAFFTTGNLIYGVELSDGWTNPMPSAAGFVWDLAGPPDPAQGHCFVAVDLTTGGIVIDTWGMLGVVTDAATAYYAAPAQGGQLFAIITDDVLNSIAARFNFPTADLIAYLDSVGNEV